MTMDDILLMAYVDGELTPRERSEVEQSISVSPEIAQRVALYAASALDYQHAFRHQKLPPVPQRLALELTRLGSAYSTTPPPIGGDLHSAPPFKWFSRFIARFRFPSRLALPGLAMTFTAGALTCAFVLRLATDRTHDTAIARSGSQHAMTASVSPWVAAAVTYQQLYTRDTVAFDATTPAIASQVVAQIHDDDRVSIHIPDLRRAGLTFKRIQRLRFHGKPLVQIVYLPKAGLPVALCVMKDDMPDTTMTQQRVESMNVLTWRRATLSYALIGALDDKQLLEIGKQIAEPSTQSG
ncbi:anti-sigma factor [Paraburkholderia sp. J67]|uniref:anti-sigma factor family protein n=1 Tax=Paraburkholderia sp. J67 TaxID=2805435 RepID=UPI002ABE9999|nr:anti-sigma factor [Paraburkholderia sp. J67]